MIARLKLKGIDGSSHKRWNVWFNSKVLEKPYQLLHTNDRVGDYLFRKDVNTGVAWPLSVRAVRCMVQSFNERNLFL